MDNNIWANIRYWFRINNNICFTPMGNNGGNMMDFEKMIKETQDMHLNSTWSGSVYALKSALNFVNHNDNIAISSKVVIKKYLEQEIERYKELQGETKIGKTLNEVERKVNERS